MMRSPSSSPSTDGTVVVSGPEWQCYRNRAGTGHPRAEAGPGPCDRRKGGMPRSLGFPRGAGRWRANQFECAGAHCRATPSRFAEATSGR
eukprot:scaffold880_cov384-Prasinococcus_capsulatus_cf.AAC.16